VSDVFPKWTNKIPLAIAAGLPVVAVAVVGAVWYWFSPSYTDVGYRPKQPVPFSHRMHAGELGMDCRYCHSTVERAAHAAIPANNSCLNCHKIVKTDSEYVQPLIKAGETGESIKWVRVHMLPGYAYFNHQAHLSAGVGCVSCHGRIDKMLQVTQYAPLSMGWCLDCHRNPGPNLRPVSEITNMGWNAKEAGYDWKADPARTRTLQPPVNCSGCHR
jgi:hypothetical protein